MKRIDFTAKEVKITGKSGKEYKFSKLITAERYRALQKYEIETSFGISFEDFYKKLETSIKLANDGKGVEAWNIIMNLKESIKDRLEDRAMPALKMLSLFLIAEDENDEDFTEKENDEKAQDLLKSGYAMSDFFQFAFNLIPSFVETLRASSRNSLQEKETEAKLKKKSI